MTTHMQEMEERRAFYCSHRTVEELCVQFNTETEKGLTRQEALHRFLSQGPNELDIEEEESLLTKFLEQINNPLIYLLLGSAFISFLIGNIEDAISITLAILIVLTVAFAQEYRSEQSLQALGKLAPPHCHVIRDGTNLEILASELVVGDIVEISRGDRIPADGRLIRASHLHTDESTLTGEGESMHKSSTVLPSTQDKDISHLSNIVFMGTMVRNGHGRFLVISTGKSTELGQVLKMMQEAESRKTPLQTKMDDLGKVLSVWSFVVIGVISIIGILQGRGYLEMFTIGVSLAVAAIPEGLPIVVTVTLALGVLRMATKKAIVKKLPAVESLGSVDVICVDKTGTVTTNQMTVTHLFTCANSTVYKIPHRENPSLPSHEGFDLLLEVGSICNNATVTESNTVQGDRTEVAILQLLRKLSIADHRQSHNRISEKAFTAEDKWMLVESKSKQSDKVSFYAKGALERILELCVGYVDNQRAMRPMNEDMLETIRRKEQSIAGSGLRVLALAYGTSKENLFFVGLMGFQDPPRQGTEETISSLLSAGISIVMITGDSEGTAKAIAKQIGLSSHDSDIDCLSGLEIDRISPEELATRLNGTAIFYRTTPGHKMNIIKAFQLLGKTVAMTGDGVNDAPALRLADIGIAMGKSGTDVAKEAADMILMTDDLSTLPYAVEEGRAIFKNIQNFLSFQLSTSVAALSLIALSTFAGLESPLNPMQILWINILCDGPVAQSLGVEDADPDIMQQPPRPRDERILSFTLFSRLFLSALVILVGTLFIFVWFRVDGLDAKDQTMTFTCFVFFDLWNSLSCRSSTRSVFEIGLFSNKMWNIAAGLCFLGQLCVIYVPFFQSVFKTTSISTLELFQLLLFTSTIFVVDETRKFIARSSASKYTHQYDRMA